jgi:hypothetical protein
MTVTCLRRQGIEIETSSVGVVPVLRIVIADILHRRADRLRITITSAPGEVAVLVVVMDPMIG